jgi:hypothetical protein
VFLIDSDRQIPLDNFQSAWAEVMAGRDAVIRRARRRYDPVLRLYLSRLIRHSVNVCSASIFAIRTRRTSYSGEASGPRRARASRWNARALAVSRHRGEVARLQHPRDRRDAQGTRHWEVTLRKFRLLKFCAKGLGQMLGLDRRVR